MSRTLRLLPFIGKPTAAKASLDTQRCALRCHAHVQTLSLSDPIALAHLEHYAASLRERVAFTARARLRSERTS